MTRPFAELVRALATASNEDADEIHEEMLATVYDPRRRKAALAALSAALDGKLPSHALGFYLGRHLLEDEDLGGFESLAKHRSPAVRAGALNAIDSSSRIGEGARRAAFSTVERALDDPEAVVRAEACSALKNLSERIADPRTVVRRLKQLLEDSDGRVRREATWAVAVLGKNMVDLASFIPVLRRRLEDEDSDVRAAAASALKTAARRGVDITSCVPLLRRAAQSDEVFRHVAKGALAAFEGRSSSASRKPTNKHR